MLKRLPLKLLLAGTIIVSLLNYVRAVEGRQVIVLQNGPDKPLEAAVVLTLEDQGAGILITDKDGKKSAAPRNSILARLPYPGDAEPGISEEKLEKIVGDYKAAVEKLPAAGAGLAPFLDEWNAQLTGLRKRTAAAKEARQLALDRFLGATVEKERVYSRAEAEAHIAQAPPQLAANPDKAALIEENLAPWKMELEQIVSGSTKIDGVWFTQAELAEKQKRADRERLMKFAGEELHIPLKSEILPARTMMILTACLGLSVCAFIFLIIDGVRSRSMLTSFFGMLLLGVSAWTLLLALEVNDDLPGSDGDPLPLITILMNGNTPSLPAPPTPVDYKDINAFIPEYLNISPAPPGGWVLQRKEVRVSWGSDAVDLFETAQFLNRSFSISYHMPFTTRDEGIRFEGCSAKVGHMMLPPFMANWLCIQSQKSYTTLFKDDHLKRIQLHRIEGSTMYLGVRPSPAK